MQYKLGMVPVYPFTYMQSYCKHNSDISQVWQAI